MGVSDLIISLSFDITPELQHIRIFKLFLDHSTNQRQSGWGLYLQRVHQNRGGKRKPLI